MNIEKLGDVLEKYGIRGYLILQEGARFTIYTEKQDLELLKKILSERGFILFEEKDSKVEGRKKTKWFYKHYVPLELEMEFRYKWNVHRNPYKCVSYLPIQVSQWRKYVNTMSSS